MNITDNLKILFLLIKSRINADGNAPLYCKITQNNQQKRFALGYFLPIKLWSQSKQIVTGKSTLAQNANAKIQELTNKIQSIEAQFIKGQEEYSIDDILNKLLNRNTTPFRTLMQAYEYKHMHMQMQELKDKEYKSSTLEKSIQMQKVVSDFMNEALGANDILLSQVDTQFQNEFEFYLRAKVTSPLPLAIGSFSFQYSAY